MIGMMMVKEMRRKDVMMMKVWMRSAGETTRGGWEREESQ